MTDDRLSELAHRNLLGVFGERDPQARARAIAETYTEDVTFADPEEVVTGRDAIGRKAQGLLDGAPGFVFRPAGPVRVVQDLVTLAWHFGPEGQPPVATGVDISLVVDGRIARLWTLLDAPAGE